MCVHIPNRAFVLVCLSRYHVRVCVCTCLCHNPEIFWSSICCHVFHNILAVTIKSEPLGVLLICVRGSVSGGGMPVDQHLGVLQILGCLSHHSVLAYRIRVTWTDYRHTYTICYFPNQCV